MRPKLLLRIAAVVMLLHTLGHTIGAYTWDEAPNPAVKTVIDGMKNNHFVFMGRSVTIANFYMGYGYSMIGVLLLTSVLLWLLSNNPTGILSRQLQLALAAFLLFFAAMEYIYFFPFAAALSLVAGLCTVIAAFKWSA